MGQKAKGTFMSINHAPAQSNGGSGGSSVTVDMSPVAGAIKALTDEIRALKLTVSVQVPEPHIVEVAPVIHLPTPEATPVHVTLPEMSPRVTLPEMAPRIEVHPADVVITQADGKPMPQPLIEINIPWWAVFGVGAVPILTLIVDMILRHQ